MAENTTEPPITVSGEERPHPALRKLGRACIALVRWQRGELEGTTTTPAPPEAKARHRTPNDPSTTSAPEAGEIGAAHE